MYAEFRTDVSETGRGPSVQWNDDLIRVLPPIPLRPWHAGYNALHHAKVGVVLGGVAGCISLLANVIGSVLWSAISGPVQHPLRLIQVYLTFPLGESALQLDTGAILALGCVLYLITGMLYGMLFEVVISYLMPNAGVWIRLASCSVLAILVWLLNFYGLLIWLQPLLCGGRWIMDIVPWWVAVLTHLVFGWTVALIYPGALFDGERADPRT